jgi:hypothetical protein
LDSAGDSSNYKAHTNTGKCFRQLTHLPAFKYSLWVEEKFYRNGSGRVPHFKAKKITRKWISTADTLQRIFYIPLFNKDNSTIVVHSAEC